VKATAKITSRIRLRVIKDRKLIGFNL
jgi:hypothetical protein